MEGGGRGDQERGEVGVRSGREGKVRGEKKEIKGLQHVTVTD